MRVPIKHLVTETDSQLVVQDEQTVHVHAEDETVSVDRDWGIIWRDASRALMPLFLSLLETSVCRLIAI
jgi:hypothetical protein